MSATDHERARELIALGDAEDLSTQHQTWLRNHLEECLPCREYAEAANQMFRILHSELVTLDPDLLQSTQRRLRTRALELRQQQQRLWLVCMSCFSVGISAAITTPLFWRAFEWLGIWLGISSAVRQSGFVFLWIAPALMVATVLLARGSHLSTNNKVEMQWK